MPTCRTELAILFTAGRVTGGGNPVTVEIMTSAIGPRRVKRPRPVAALTVRVAGHVMAVIDLEETLADAYSRTGEQSQ